MRPAATPILDYFADLVDNPELLREAMQDREAAIKAADLPREQQDVLLTDDLVLVHAAIDAELGRRRPERPTVMVEEPEPDEPEPPEPGEPQGRVLAAAG
jgi:hypothetical protein